MNFLPDQTEKNLKKKRRNPKPNYETNRGQPSGIRPVRGWGKGALEEDVALRNQIVASFG